MTDAIEMRKRYLEQHANGNPALKDIIPATAANLFEDQFGIKFQNIADIPVIFIVGWKHVLKYMKAQPDDEFALDVAGISIEYVTEFSESDKSRNIVPQMFHLRTPVFVKQDKQTVPGFKAPNAQLESYTMWRTENLTETLEKIENDVYAELVNTFQIDTWYSVAILPIMAAVYRAGIELARASKSAVNMYNIFEIRIAPDEQIILTPLAEIKQSLKSDAVKTDVPVPF